MKNASENFESDITYIYIGNILIFYLDIVAIETSEII